jgi:hypothetical protein
MALKRMGASSRARTRANGLPQNSGRLPNCWRTYAPSPIVFAAGEVPPVALDRDRLVAIRNAFVGAVRRASRLGLNFIQVLGGTAICSISSFRLYRTAGTTSTGLIGKPTADTNHQNTVVASAAETETRW